MRSTYRLYNRETHESVLESWGAHPWKEWPAASRSHAARGVIPSQDGTDDSVFVRYRVG